MEIRLHIDRHQGERGHFFMEISGGSTILAVLKDNWIDSLGG